MFSHFISAMKKQSRALSDDRMSIDSQMSSASLTPNSNSSQTSGNKKARVFFSEEQKDMLRDAYAKDPYPNPATIEQLAQRIGVMSKTVVNWFHNHRMRAKQTPQYSSSNSSTSSITSENVKCEEDSNNCDTPPANGLKSLEDGPMGMLGSLGPLHGLYHHPQWMFPGFDPLAFSGAAFQHHQAMLAAQTARQQSQGPEDSPNSTPEQEQPFDLSTKPGTPPAGSQESAKPAQTVNKRKAAKPQWAKEGVELDRSRHFQQSGDDDDDQKDAPDTTTCESPDKNTAENENTRDDSENMNPETDTENVVTGTKTAEKQDNILKLQRGVQSCADAERRGNIDRLAKNLVTDSKESSDWEF